MKKGHNYLNNQSGSAVVMVILMIAIGVGLYFYLGQSNLSLPKNTLTSSKIPTKTTNNPTSSAQVLITRDGFIPASVTVAKGQQVIWVNSNANSHSVSSFPKTTTNDVLGFDSETLQPLDSFSFIFEDAGIFTYHDDQTPNSSKFKGTVIVN